MHSKRTHASHQCKMLQSDVTNPWFKRVRKLNFRDGKMQAILAFLDNLSKEESVNTRDKIICEFGQATYEYVIVRQRMSMSYNFLLCSRVCRL